MDEETKIELSGTTFRALLTGGLAIAGGPKAALAAGATSVAVDLVSLANKSLFERATRFVDSFFAGVKDDEFAPLREKLESEPGIKTTAATVKAFADLLDDAAEPALRRLALDYIVAGQRPDAFFRCFAGMLTHCDAVDIRDMRAIFNMLMDRTVDDMMIAPGVSIVRDGEKAVISASGQSAVAIIKHPTGGPPPQSMAVADSIAVSDPSRVMRLLDNYRITKERSFRVLGTNVTGGVIAKNHVGYLFRAFMQT